MFFLFQFRSAVCRWLGRGGSAPCFRSTEKCGKLDSCSKSQSFFAGINLVQAGNSGGGVGGGGTEKSQTLSTTLPDSARVSTSSWLNL